MSTAAVTRQRSSSTRLLRARNKNKENLTEKVELSGASSRQVDILTLPGFRIRKQRNQRAKTCISDASTPTSSPGKLRQVQETTPLRDLVAPVTDTPRTPPKRKQLLQESQDVSPNKRSPGKRLPLSPCKNFNNNPDTQEADTFKSQVRKSPRKSLSSSFNSLKEVTHQPKVTETPTTISHVASTMKVKSPKISKADILPSPEKDKSNSTASSDDIFSSVKKALNTQQPDRVVCREKEIDEIDSFLQSRVDLQRPGSLYISGAPGTGKTAVIKHILATKYQNDLKKVFINAMTLKSSYTMYKAIATELLGEKKAASLRSAKSASSQIQKFLSTQGEMVLLVLDELDQLDSKNQEVLYTIFEWPSLPHSRLVLIGIANALDLTDRILPRLHLRPECKPQLLNFAPYTREQIVTVLESRLSETPELSGQVVDKSAMLFCARKVSAVAGDMRKALDICRRSVEVTQLASRKNDLLSIKAGKTVSPVKASPLISKVSVMQVASVVDEVYGSVSSAAAKNNSTFPLQQKLIACTLLLMFKNSKLKEVTLGKAHDSYCRVCKKRDVTSTDQSEFLALCQLLETRGLVGLKRAKETRQWKISLKMEARELEFALQDKLLISSVLESGL